jgi:hypothetical protein
MSRLRGAPDAAVPGPDPRDLVRKPLPEGELRIGAITYCRNEKNFLPLWIKYYGEQFGLENLYVIDDNSDDGSTDNLPVDVVRVPEIRDGEFNVTRMSFVGNFARALFELYDVLLFCDTDEFVIPDPDKYSGLRDFIEQQPEDVLAVAAFGLNVVHATKAEGPIDLSRPLLGQRQLAKFLPLMCKPSIKWVLGHWAAATHGVNAPYEVHPDLWMFHFKYGDEGLLQEAADHRKSMVEADGRSATTSWAKSGDELVELLHEITADVTDVTAIPDFQPWTGDKLAELVIHDTPIRWRAPIGNQTRSMRRRPLVRIPERFHGIV